MLFDSVRCTIQPGGHVPSETAPMGCQPERSVERIVGPAANQRVTGMAFYCFLSPKAADVACVHRWVVCDADTGTVCVMR